jgi:hypothetical protein
LEDWLTRNLPPNLLFQRFYRFLAFENVFSEFLVVTLKLVDIDLNVVETDLGGVSIPFIVSFFDDWRFDAV